MSQISVNVVAPLGYTGSTLTGDNNYVQIVDASGNPVFKSSQIGNTLVGEESLSSLTSGANNTGVGASSLKICTTGGNNSSFGHSSMANVTSGGLNTAIGSGSMSDSATGNGNSALGTNSLALCISGDFNTAVGYNAGVSATGSNNVYIGYAAAQLQTVGNNNITIGNNAANATNTSSNQITLGNSSNNILRCAVTSITSLSDARDKSSVEDSEYGLELVKSLRPVTFEWDTRDGAKKGVKDLGFIAQELQSVDNEHLGLVYDENPDKLEATYGRLIPVLVKAIQELTAKVEALEAK
jgi:hypothetical protein